MCLQQWLYVYVCATVVMWICVCNSGCIDIRACQFLSKTSKHPGWEFLLCLLVHWSATKNFSMVAQLLHGLNLRFNLNRDYNGKRAQKQNILEKTISDGPSANLRPLFNSNVTKVSVLKWSQNWPSTIRALLEIKIELRNTSSFLGLYSSLRSRSRLNSRTHRRF